MPCRLSAATGWVRGDAVRVAAQPGTGRAAPGPDAPAVVLFRHAAPVSGLRPSLVGLLLLALCAFLAGVAVHALWVLLGGLTSGASWIDMNTGAAGAVPAAIAIGCWSAVLLGWRMTDRTERRIMRLSFACVPLVVLLPLAVTPLAHMLLSDQGYERCRIDPGRRFPGARYHHGAPEACP
ncbi:hypothetical protein [Roseomonas populi]|uniref:DUF1109 domain-containing protein n=1 Tax=Roseomonas populi TaxID=3121582 RepID=A0ABT1WZC3_9PROT|nr:hypothetical protein [Roseomonas pecuniae]MCR0981193.1 hypothetical protein [Roseomonas pecuniae]